MKIRKPRRTIAAAVSIDPDLYQLAMEKRVIREDTNFSRYVRELIRADLNSGERLPVPAR